MSNKFSIVTPTYNCQELIGDTIESVRQQYNTDIEYIVIDGGSSDGTLNVLRKYESTIDKWISEPDDGISQAFNKGIRLATGDVVGLLNAGDTYEAEALKRVSECVDRFPGHDVFYGDIYMLYSDGEIAYTRKAREDLTVSDFRYSMPAIPHPSVFVRHDLYKRRLFNTKLEYAMDYEWLRDMAKRGVRFQYIEGECLACMRIEGKSNNQYVDTLHEVHQICIEYGDNAFLSFFYNELFRTFRFKVRQILESTHVGRCAVELYRRLISLFGLRNWRY